MSSLIVRIAPRVARPTCVNLNKNNPVVFQSRTIARIACTSLNQIRSKWAQVCQSLETDGAVIFSSPLDNKDLTIDRIGQLFGLLQGHGKCDEKGVMRVTSGSKYEAQAQETIHFNDMFFPHTDGAYLSGIAYNNKIHSMQRITPPKIIGLRAIETAKKGGETVLVDGRGILKQLILSDSDLLPFFFNGEGTAFCHGSIMCTNMPLFSWDSKDRCQIRYSYDKEFYYREKYEPIYKKFQTDYVDNPNFRAIISLKPGDALFVDNLRMLHGRTPLVGDRLYQRLWVAQDVVPLVFPNAQNIHYDAQTDAHKCTLPYSKYLTFEPTISPCSIQFKPGIDLSKVEQNQLGDLLR